MSKNNKWTNATQGINTITVQYEKKIRFGLETFANKATLDAAIPSTPGAIKAALAKVSLKGDTYMLPAVAEARKHLISVLSKDKVKGRPTNIMLITDGSPSDRCPIKEVNALRKLVVNGTTYDVKTYVVGFGANVNPICLNNLAVAGGTGLSGAINYYVASNSSTFNAVAAKIANNANNEVCNGLDDDCDGKVDNVKGASTAISRQCLVGRCDGSQSCSNGAWLTCRPKQAPSAETCNGKDDDCDGYIDNSKGTGQDNTLRQSCNTTCGQGQRICNAGTWGACTAPSSKPETCNGKDDDCDGKVDNINGSSNPIVQACTVGRCAAQRLCRNASWDSCRPKQAPSAETCNGKDDDCDGYIDNFKGSKQNNTLTQACFGTCGRGTETCNTGKWQGCTAVPSPEQCNGKDDDCDGSIDNIKGTSNTLRQRCTVGRCAASRLCRQGSWTACTPNTPPSAEVCNGKDDDCDGYIDNPKGTRSNYSLTRSCTDKCGQGTQRCFGSRWSSCSSAAKPESCNGKDDDCDGKVDNRGNSSLTRACTKGNCPGNQVCTLGRWGLCQALGGAKTETCNNRDDDCDGTVDEGLSRSCRTACGSGTERCRRGRWIGCTAQLPRTETCDGKDNDCDGQIDEHIIRACPPCGTQQCQLGRWGSCVQGKTQPETCNNKDDDCDGFIDNAKNVKKSNTLTQTCKNACGSGTETCNRGKWQNCSIKSSPERCNGKDDDCDGKIDENWSFYLGPPAKSCKKLCQTGVYKCRPDGSDVFCAVPGITPEVCDGRDNDCNGLIDESWPQKGKICFAGSGACQKTGLFICRKSGTGLECSAKAPNTPEPEKCDGIDNNCDGKTDEGLSRPCSTACGSGRQTCQEGSWTLCSSVTPKTELCNNKDDDCDGKTDEDFKLLGQACRSGQGACERSGRYICDKAGKGVQCDATPGQGGKEVCDGKDNDCDGQTDEGCKCKPGEIRACGSTTGACRPGKQTCNGGQWSTCTGGVAATKERCNGKDDDCDGSTDEDFAQLGRNCSEGKGACLRQGKFVCKADGSGLQCNANPGKPSQESCNGKDDDCDGNIDENLSQACKGACGTGIQFCKAGTWDTCTTRKPEPETCNGKDDDCNGTVDDLKPRVCQTKCGRGQERCVNGKWAFCDAPKVSDEVCDGKDNDCNGQIDDGVKPKQCQGACGQGVAVCQNGQFTGCSGPQPELEKCDGKDNDCNGKIDDKLSRTCKTKCGEGQETCRAGKWQACSAPKEGQEICDGLDNDCDTKIDNGAKCPPGQRCVQGGCRRSCIGGECPKGEQCRNGLCFSGSCTGVTCSNGKVCKLGVCVDPCAGVSCPKEQVCKKGKCYEKNCYAFGCPKGERCVEGKCQSDPCLGINCTAEQFCRDGKCIDACKGCPAGQRCTDGQWEADPCAATICPERERCEEGKCSVDLCTNVTCPEGKRCQAGQCTHDACFNITCPNGTTCSLGECVASKRVCPQEVVPERANADAGEPHLPETLSEWQSRESLSGEFGTQGQDKGGAAPGCGCTSSAPMQTPLSLLLLCLGFFLLRRQR